MVLSCDCKSSRKGNDRAVRYQDTKYGKGKRVHNKAVGPNNTVVYRCTICGTEREK